MNKSDLLKSNPYFQQVFGRLTPTCAADPGWLALLLIVSSVPALRPLVRHVDFEREEIDIRSMVKHGAHLSDGEFFMLLLGLHLLNPANNLPLDGLASMRLLDHLNFATAQTAIRLAYRS